MTRDTSRGLGESTCICIVFNKILTFLNWIPLHKFAANSNKSQQTKNQITTKVWEQWNFPHSTHTHSHTYTSAHLGEANLALASTSMSGWTCVGANFITSLNNCAPKCSGSRKEPPRRSPPLAAVSTARNFAGPLTGKRRRWWWGWRCGS